MAKRIFSVDYWVSYQRRFGEALGKGEYNLAIGILESIPVGSNFRERSERALTIVEGYRSVWGEIKDGLPKLGGLDNKLIELDEFKEAADGRDPAGVKDVLVELAEYQSYGDLDELERLLHDGDLSSLERI